MQTPRFNLEVEALFEDDSDITSQVASNICPGETFTDTSKNRVIDFTQLSSEPVSLDLSLSRDSIAGFQVNISTSESSNELATTHKNTSVKDRVFNEFLAAISARGSSTVHRRVDTQNA
ncbi:hypothetical protein HAX54_021887 [Datura stramonium]|uniref:Uncharacterized protein n=1 Tax=Datura stramonium TaxID=4076 RepID=A0ABS8S3S9_DATST|nr:hypothetical protein [Datura stramonium]